MNDTTLGKVLLVRGLNPFPDEDVLEIMDSANIKKGKFKLKFKASEVNFYTLRIKNTNRFISLVGKPGDKIKLEWNINEKLNEATSSKSIENDVYINKMINLGRPIIYNINRFQDSASLYKLKKDSVKASYSSSQNNYWFDSLQRLYLHILETYPNYYASLFTMSKQYNKFNDEYVKKYLNQLPEYLKNNSLAIEINYNKFILPEEVKNIKTFADFQFTDSLLNRFDYSPYLGKIVLVDFWASWCKPCIENFPKLAGVLAVTDRKNFEVLGISLDDTNNSWLNGLRRLKPGWMNVRDPKAWQGLVVSYFKIKSIPRYILLGRNGQVLNDNVKGDNFEVELNKYLDK